MPPAHARFAMGVRLLYDSVGMTNRTPIAFQSHTNRTMKVVTVKEDSVRNRCNSSTSVRLTVVDVHDVFAVGADVEGRGDSLVEGAHPPVGEGAEWVAQPLCLEMLRRDVEDAHLSRFGSAGITVRNSDEAVGYRHLARYRAAAGDEHPVVRVHADLHPEAHVFDGQGDVAQCMVFALACGSDDGDAPHTGGVAVTDRLGQVVALLFRHMDDEVAATLQRQPLLLRGGGEDGVAVAHYAPGHHTVIDQCKGGTVTAHDAFGIVQQLERQGMGRIVAAAQDDRLGGVGEGCEHIEMFSCGYGRPVGTTCRSRKPRHRCRRHRV